MANWHYYNKNGEKVGPISVAALKALTQQGLITRETVLENHTGRTVVAGDINGLTFSDVTTSAEPETVPVADIDPACIAPAQSEVYDVSTPTLKAEQPAEPNPFMSAPPTPTVEANPFTASKPEESNPFTGLPPTSTIQQTMPVHAVSAGISEPIFFGGIVAILIILFTAGVCMIPSESKFGAKDQASVTIATEIIEYAIKNERDILDLSNGWTKEDAKGFAMKFSTSALRNADGDGAFIPKPEFKNTCDLYHYLLFRRRP